MTTPDDSELYKQIDEILWNEWDPIGVNEWPEARDEYYGYIPTLVSLKKQNATKEIIAGYLYKMETENIGLSGGMDNCQRVAEKIVHL